MSHYYISDRNKSWYRQTRSSGYAQLSSSYATGNGLRRRTPLLTVYIMNLTSGNVTSFDILFTTVNSVSVLVCLLAAILVIILKLYKKLVYRLALYQVLSSLIFAIVEVFEIIFINYSQRPDVYGRVCTAIGWFSVYTRWIKLLFTMWVAVHLFCFGVFHKNLKRLELLYVVTSLLVPAVIAAVPLDNP